jgi:hypothetical protein
MSHLKKSTEAQNSYNAATSSPQREVATGKLCQKLLPMPETATKGGQGAVKSLRRSIALQKMIAGVLPVGFMPCIPLIRDLPADLYGALSLQYGSYSDSTGMTQQQNKNIKSVFLII